MYRAMEHMGEFE